LKIIWIKKEENIFLLASQPMDKRAENRAKGR